MIRHRQIAATVLCVAALLGRVACGDEYDPPVGYYSAATGTGATLKQQLNTIISTGHTPISYDAARSALQITDDATPANPNDDLIMLVYNRAVLNVANLTGPPPGWDQGTSWDREHTWPQSRGLGGTGGPDGSDLHALRPSTPSVNNSRGNSNFGGAFDSQPASGQPYGYVTDNGNSMWYPGNAEAGMIARHAFYMDVRYDGSDSGTTDLEVVTGNPAINGTAMGDKNRLVEWHFAAPPDSFERRRNHVIDTDYQNNRNPFVDRPELMWSVFIDQSNDSRITISGGTIDANNGSTRNVDLGRVFKNSAMPEAETFMLNKNGTDGTYFEVTTTGLATSSISGRNNAFRTNQIDSQSIDIGLDTNTGSTGLRSGTVTVNNLDVTTSGGSGRGANDANDVFNVSLTVLDHATPSFLSETTVTTLPINFGTVTTASAAQSTVFNVFNRGTDPAFTANMDFDSVLSSGDTSLLTTNAEALAGSLVLAGGASQMFSAFLNTTAAGTFAASYTLRFSDENIPGAENNKDITLSLSGTVVLAGDFNRDGFVDASDYVVWRKMNGLSTSPFSGADADGSGFVDAADLGWWQQNFGMTAAAGSGGFRNVPEPAGAALAVIGLVVIGRFARTRKA